MKDTNNSFELILGVTIGAYATVRFDAANDQAAIEQAHNELAKIGDHVLKPDWSTQQDDRIVTLVRAERTVANLVPLLQDVYVEAQPKAVDPDLHECYAALVARVARVYLPGDIGPNGVQVLTEMSPASLQATLRELVEAARVITEMRSPIAPGVLFCPKCSGPTKAAGSVFIEAGEWEGNSYEVEGDFDAHKCVSCGFTFAEAELPASKESSEIAA